MNNPAPAIGNSAGSLIADPTGTITTVHFIVIAIVAVVVVLALIYGARLKHRRHVAEREVQDHAVETERAGGTATDEAPDATPEAPAPDATPPAPAPMPETAAAPAPRPAEQVLPPEQPAAEEGPATGPVTQIKGLGPKVAARLAEVGITTVGQIAALDEDGAEALDARLGPFSGRLARDRWVEQARFLAAGDRAGFEAVFGRL